MQLRILSWNCRMAGLDLLHEHSILTALPTLQSKGLFAQQLSISLHSALLSYSCLSFWGGGGGGGGAQWVPDQTAASVSANCKQSSHSDGIKS